VNTEDRATEQKARIKDVSGRGEGGQAEQTESSERGSD
jgi:hypothetical protein